MYWPKATDFLPEASTRREPCCPASTNPGRAGAGALGAFAKSAYPPGDRSRKHRWSPGVLGGYRGRLALSPEARVTVPACAGAGRRGVSRRRRRTSGPSSLGASPSPPALPGSAQDGRRRRRRRTGDNAIEPRPRPPHSPPWPDPSAGQERHDARLLRPSARGPCTSPAQSATLSPPQWEVWVAKCGTVANERSKERGWVVGEWLGFSGAAGRHSGVSTEGCACRQCRRYAVIHLEKQGSLGKAPCSAALGRRRPRRGSPRSSSGARRESRWSWFPQ